MTMFDKEKFTWDGMYLMYEGQYKGAKMMLDVHPDAHPLWEGKLKPAFVARFKYKKNYKTWINFLVKNKISAENYFELAQKMAPLEAMWKLGFKK